MKYFLKLMLAIPIMLSIGLIDGCNFGSDKPKDKLRRTELEQSITELRTSNSKCDEDNKKLLEQIALLEKTIKDLQEELRKREKKVEAGPSTPSYVKRKAYRSRLGVEADLRARIAKLEAEVALLYARIDELERENSALKGRIRELEMENEGLRAKLAEVQRMRLEADASAQDDASRALAAELAEKETALQARADELDRLQAELNARFEEIENQKAELERKKLEAVAATPDIYAAREAELKKYEEELEKREALIAERESKLAKREAELRAMMMGMSSRTTSGGAAVPMVALFNKTDVGLRASHVGTDTVDLAWDATPEELGATELRVYRNGSFLKTVSGGSFTDKDLSPDSTNCYTITAVNADGIESEIQRICTKTMALPDNLPPGLPIYLVATSIGDNYAELQWMPLLEGSFNVAGYNIYEDGALSFTLMENALPGNYFTVNNLNGNTRYCYFITAFDAGSNESASSNEVCIETLFQDKNKPTTPTAVTLAPVDESEVDLSWSAATDDVGVAGYNVYKDGVFMKAVATTSAFNLKMEDSEVHCYSISSIDRSGNESRRSQDVCLSKKDAMDAGAAWGGSIWSGGMNDFGQLGHGNMDDTLSLVYIDTLGDISKASAGVEHTLALKSDGTVWAWGRNDKGQLGTGDDKDAAVPVQVAGLEDVIDVSTGWAHSVALKKDGTVWAWGRNYYGQVGTGSYGDIYTPTQVLGIKDIVAIAAGGYHTLALKKDGTIWAWGWNHKGQLGSGNKETSKKPTQVIGIDNVDMVSAGMYHSAALKSDGTVWEWGADDYGQLGVGDRTASEVPLMVEGLTGMKYISAGMNHTAAVRSDGAVWAWGRNEYGQVGALEGAAIIKPEQVQGIGGVKSVSSGAYHTLALKEDGTVWGWGWKTGERYKRNEAAPVKVSGISGVMGISAGKNYSLAVRGK